MTQVVFDFEGGGLETLVADMSRRFSASGMKVSVVTLSGREGRLGAAVRDSLESLIPVRSLPLASMILPLRIRRAIRATRPDVVHLHSGAWLKPALAARLAGVRRVIYTEHGREHDDPMMARWIDRRAAALTDAVVAVSARLRDYLQSTVGIQASRLHVIENGVDTEVFTPGESSAMRASLGIPAGTFVVGSVGRLEPVKAYHRLIQAFATARAERATDHRMMLVIAGDGSQREALRDEARRLGVEDSVRLPGWVDRPAELYRLLDVFVLSSLSEGMSVSLLEAMSSGALPAVMDVGANAELLGPGLSGQVVPSGDGSALARLLAAAAADPSRGAALRRVARERVVTGYSLARMADAYRALYTG